MMNDGPTIKLNPGGQTAFFLDDHRVRGLFGGRGSGKSAGGSLAALKEIDDQPGLPGAVIAPDYPGLVKSTLPEFLNWVPEGAIIDQNKDERWFLFRNGSKVYYSGIDDPDSWRGPNLAWAWFDESGRKKKIDAWLVILGCVRIGNARLFTTSTPKGKTHWLHDTFVKNAKPEIHSHHFASSRDNAHNLDPLYIETLEASYVGGWREQELEGRFIELGGTIFQRQWFDIVDQAPEGIGWVRFWDLACSVRQAADYTCGGKVGLSGDGIYISDMVRGQWPWPQAQKVIIETAQEDGTGVLLGVEQAGMQLAAIQQLQVTPELTGYWIQGAVPDRDKLARAMPWAARAEQGLVHLVNGPWVHDFLNEVCDFPQGAHDDQVDAVSGAVQILAGLQEQETIVVYEEPVHISPI